MRPAVTAIPLFELDPPRARGTDPETSHRAARKVRPANQDLVNAIRATLKDFGPLTAFEIASHVLAAHGNRWSEATVRTACARAGLEKYEYEATSPRGLPCAVYCLTVEDVTVQGGRL